MTVDTLEELEENFDLFDSWEDKYSYLIDLGKALPPMDDALKTDERKVKGCVSQVWIDWWVDSEGERQPVFRFVADSDALIVKGLVYILYTAYNDKTAAEIAGVNIEEVFERLGLSSHLSPNRRNGFFSMWGIYRRSPHNPRPEQRFARRLFGRGFSWCFAVFVRILCRVLQLDTLQNIYECAVRILMCRADDFRFYHKP